MVNSFKKASRTQTLARLSEVAQETVGNQTQLDEAFAAFDAPLEDDPDARKEAQARLRRLLLPDDP